MKNVVLFSGLAANQHIFDFLDLGTVNKTYINWVVPHPGESLTQYARRLAGQIPYDRPILIGVSFGGMVAAEMSKYLETEKVIVISSAGSHHGIPLYYKMIGLLKLHKLLPASFAAKNGKLLCNLLGIQTDEQKTMLLGILSKVDPVFFHRAINMILGWRNETPPSNFYHIHGTRDWLLPLRVRCQQKIDGGGHFMIVDRAREISTWLQTVIQA